MRFPGHIFILLFFCLVFRPVSAQNNDLLKLLEKAAVGGKVEDAQKAIEQLDYVDFQFAVSQNQGAGFFDIEQKGETKNRYLYTIKRAEDKSDLEIVRDDLLTAIRQYRIRRYEWAENNFRKLKARMESNSVRLSYREDSAMFNIVHIRIISNLGLVNLTQGKTAEAGIHISKALEMSLKEQGMESPAYIANLNNMAKLHQTEGRYGLAEKAFQEAIDLANTVFAGGMQNAVIINNMAILYQTLGRYDEAIELMEGAVSVALVSPKQGLEGKKSVDSRRLEANLGTVYQVAGRYEEANEIFKKIKKVYESRKQTKSAEYAGLNNQMGKLYIQMGRYDKVREYFVTALNIYKRKWGEDNIYFARAAHELGSFQLMRKNYEEAKTWLSKANQIRTQLLNPTHPEYIMTREALAIYHWKTGNTDKAYTLYKEVMGQTMVVVEQFFPSMSEVEKTKYWDITSPRFQRFYNFALAIKDKNPQVLEDIFNYSLATKGILLSATSGVKNAILASNDIVLINDYLSWKDQKDQLSRLYGYSKGKLKAMDIDLKALEAKANRMEKNISERSQQFSDAFESTQKNLGSIRSQLGNNEVIIDMIRVREFDHEFSDNVKYVAMILKGGSSTPEIVIIDNGNELELNRAKFYRNAIQYTIDDVSSYQSFWEPIEKKISGIEKVYLSPDGVYNQININTLLMPDGQYVVNKHNLTLMGNSSDLLQLKSRAGKSGKQDAFLLGYPDYGTPQVTLLPGTKVEVDDISNILSGGGYQVDQVMEKEATETAVKKVNNPGIVHIATHGYFQQDVGEYPSVFGVQADNAKNNPLLRSGLLMANMGGALYAEEVDIESNDNGVLTAYEVLNLDLHGTDLVVLSACETGLGEVKSGEGVYGLQRAFQVAGTNAIIMSLWKVSDDATQKLMRNFYRNWVDNPDKQVAFRQAQLQLMEEYKEPYYWGAFVMIGG